MNIYSKIFEEKTMKHKGRLIAASAILTLCILTLAIGGALIQSQPASGLSSKVSFTLDLTVKYYAHGATYADPRLVAPTWLGGDGYSPSCWVRCHGILYTVDPTVHVVNGGIDCIGFKVHGTASGTTCALHQNATYTMVSSSSGHTPAFTDTSCAATVATTNGFSIAAGTYTAGSPSGGSATDQITHTWTSATSATSSIDLACISWTNSNAANTLYAAGQIGSTTTNPGDTLETIWSFTYAST